MSDMTQQQIVNEFKRQVRLCSGLGKAEMLRIIEWYYSDKDPRSIGEQLDGVPRRPR